MKITRETMKDKPDVDDCLAHRCGKHAHIPPIDDSVGDGSECSLCVADKLLEKILEQVLNPILDAYADRLTHHAHLRRQLAVARNRLNLLSSGAGDFLSEDCNDEP